MHSSLGAAICVSDTERGQGPSLLLACWAVARVIEPDERLSKGRPGPAGEKHSRGRVPEKMAKREGGGAQDGADCVGATGHLGHV